MRGVAKIVDLRMQGYRPEMVWVTLLSGDCPTGPFMDAAMSIELIGVAEIDVAASDDLATADFRCLHGLTVLLGGQDRDRLRDAFSRIRQFDPERVIVCGDDVMHDFRKGLK